MEASSLEKDDRGGDGFGRQPWDPERRSGDELLLRFCFEFLQRFGIVQVVDYLGIALAVAGQRRVDEAGNEGVDGDAILPQFQSG